MRFAVALLLPLRDPFEQGHVDGKVCSMVLRKVANPGIFGPLDLAMVGLQIPVIPVEHQYVVFDVDPVLEAYRAQGHRELPILREHAGLEYVKLARRVQGGTEEVLLFEEWRDAASMYAWTGPELSRPRLLPGAEELVSDLTIAHYEALDIDPVED